jgi:hypothetical protein
MNEQRSTEDGSTTDPEARLKRRGRGVLFVWAGLVIAVIAIVSSYVVYSSVDDGGDDGEESLGQQGPGQAEEQAGIVNALENEGLLPEDTSAEDVEGALIRGASGQADGKHDNGEHATFTQVQTLDGDDLLELFPSEYVSSEALPALKQEILAARAFAETVNTIEKAQAAGFSRPRMMCRSWASTGSTASTSLTASSTRRSLKGCSSARSMANANSSACGTCRSQESGP